MSKRDKQPPKEKQPPQHLQDIVMRMGQQAAEEIKAEIDKEINQLLLVVDAAQEREVALDDMMEQTNEQDSDQ